MSWLFGLTEADRGGKPTPGSPPVPAATDAAQAVNRWEQAYLRSAGALDLTHEDNVEAGRPRNSQTATGNGGGAEAAAYYRQRSSPDDRPSSYGAAAAQRPGPTLAELGRSVSDASVYYAQRQQQPPRPLPTAPEASPWVDTDGGALLSTRYGGGASTRTLPGDLPSTSGSFQVCGPMQPYVRSTCHGLWCVQQPVSVTASANVKVSSVVWHSSLLFSTIHLRWVGMSPSPSIGSIIFILVLWSAH